VAYFLGHPVYTAIGIGFTYAYCGFSALPISWTSMTIQWFRGNWIE